MNATTCAYRAITGKPCIFCGMTHALWAAVHGDWSAAAAANPWWWLIATAFAVTVAVLIVRRKSPGWPVVAVIAIASLIRWF